MRRATRWQVVVALAAGLAVLTAACSDSGSDATSGAEAPAPAVVDEAAEGLLTDDTMAAYLEEAAVVPLAQSDAAEPPQIPDRPGGASGYTRYVFRETSEGEVVTSLVEGPLGEQTRCQDVGLPCSYQELKELAASGAPVPWQLGMSREELVELLGELDLAAAAVARYADPNTACAEGFVSDRTQTPNMGTHFFHMDRLRDGVFDPGRPEIIMYALAGGTAPSGPLGQCVGGQWRGEPVEAVAAAYILFIPEGAGACQVRLAVGESAVGAREVGSVDVVVVLAGSFVVGVAVSSGPLRVGLAGCPRGAGHSFAPAWGAWSVSAAVRWAQSTARPRHGDGGHDRTRARDLTAIGVPHAAGASRQRMWPSRSP